jgi:UDP-glucuronate 4-epimerase
MRTALVTGSAGFIGSFVCERLLRDGFQVIGVDAMTDYYEVSLKQQRQARLLQSQHFRVIEDYVETPGLLMELFANEKPDVGTFELLEAARAYPPMHMLLASTSSAFGANSAMPYREIDKADHQMSFYAATKKATENMAHSYAHLFGLPVTIFRFFTVYGPWGRPDMALFKFTKAILEGHPIDVYNYGDMKRDFTYIDDLVEAIRLLIDVPPVRPDQGEVVLEGDSLSPVAPWRVVNIGNSNAVQLADFIAAIEEATSHQAECNLMPMQAGDVPATWADAELLKTLTGYTPKTSVREGVAQFVEWYRKYYNI